MASGRFDKTQGKERPGTYINFEDVREYAAEGLAATGEGDGSGQSIPWKLPDFLIGKMLHGVAIERAKSKHHQSDFLQASTEIFCGSII